MLVASRLAGLSALEGHYAGGRARAQFGPRRRSCAARAETQRFKKMSHMCVYIQARVPRRAK